MKEFGQGLSPENLLGIMVSKEGHLKKAEIYVQEATLKIGEELKVKKAHVTKMNTKSDTMVRASKGDEKRCWVGVLKHFNNVIASPFYLSVSTVDGWGWGGRNSIYC